MTGYIYVITNDINGKQYVGKTTDTLENRFSDHCKEYMIKHKIHRPLYCAMEKYGREHFSISLLEECPLEVLAKQEQYWIHKLDTYKNGYNATLGGEGKQIYDYDQFINDYNLGLNIKQIAQKNHCDWETVYKVLKKANLDTSRGRTLQANNELNSPVHQYDLDGNYLQSFKSFMDAARWIVAQNKYGDITGLDHIRTNISNTAKHQQYRHTAYGFRWDTIKVDKLEPYNNENTGKSVKCINTGEIFPSLKAAGKWCNLVGTHRIGAACEGKQKSAGKHPITKEKLYWEYV